MPDERFNDLSSQATPSFASSTSTTSSRPRHTRFSAIPVPAPSKPAVDTHKAALEALFAPKQATPTPTPVAKRESAKMIVARARGEDPREEERAKLVARLLAAEGRASVSRCADDFVRAGLAFPEEQEASLQLLEHLDESRVRDALETIGRLLDVEPPRRRTVLDSRLRRLEEGADEAATRALAETLRRRLGAIRARPC